MNTKIKWFISNYYLVWPENLDPLAGSHRITIILQKGKGFGIDMTNSRWPDHFQVIYHREPFDPMPLQLKKKKPKTLWQKIKGLFK